MRRHQNGLRTGRCVHRRRRQRQRLQHRRLRISDTGLDEGCWHSGVGDVGGSHRSGVSGGVSEQRVFEVPGARLGERWHDHVELVHPVELVTRDAVRTEHAGVDELASARAEVPDLEQRIVDPGAGRGVGDMRRHRRWSAHRLLCSPPTATTTTTATPAAAYLRHRSGRRLLAFRRWRRRWQSSFGSFRRRLGATRLRGSRCPTRRTLARPC